jgi:hypothetical protein
VAATRALVDGTAPRQQRVLATVVPLARRDEADGAVGG